MLSPKDSKNLIIHTWNTSFCTAKVKKSKWGKTHVCMFGLQRFYIMPNYRAYFGCPPEYMPFMFGVFKHHFLMLSMAAAPLITLCLNIQFQGPGCSDGLIITGLSSCKCFFFQPHRSNNRALLWEQRWRLHSPLRTARLAHPPKEVSWVYILVMRPTICAVPARPIGLTLWWCHWFLHGFPLLLGKFQYQTIHFLEISR